jgi:hypothetical protein
LQNDENAGTLLMDKYNVTYQNIQQILPSAPRTLTQPRRARSPPNLDAEVDIIDPKNNTKKCLRKNTQKKQ